MHSTLFRVICASGDKDVPLITSASTANCAENATLAHALTANEGVTWSIVGGADQARFELSGSTLRWASNGTKDFETPDDADTNNTYVVTVRATDLAGNFSEQTITVTVTDVAEAIGFYGDTANSDTNANNYTFTDMAVGEAHASRIVALVLLWRLSTTDRNPTSITIGGVAATLVVKTHAASGHGAGIYYAAVPTGTTATVVIGGTSDSGVLLAIRAVTYRVIPVTSTPLDSGSNAGNSNPLTIADVEVQSGGWLVCAGITVNTTASSASYNGTDTPTEDLNTQMESAVVTISWSTNTAQSSTTNDPGTTNAVSRRVVAASWK